MPCSSGNSLTRRDCRSAFDSSAARRASAGSTPTCAAIASASAATRATLSATRAELGLVGDARQARRPSTPGPASGPRRRRTSHRRSAGGSRARSPCGLRPTSFDSMLAMPMKCSVSLPSASSTGKNFWLASMVATSASCGTAQELALEAAQHRARPFDQAVHLLRGCRRRCGRRRRPALRGVLDFAHDALAAFVRIDQHLARRAARRRNRRARRSTPACRAWKRWPRLLRPARTPSTSPSTTSSPSSSTSQCTGRAKA